ncbi:MAG TPA: TetR/AcrR family transcriptional regulator [Sphingomonas sp.]|uniref:TetR/AcrR family transcriptional regulator n=1 Tax=Sphingomonas sp. TaxID=28214 RepID=UPI002EDA05EE
MASTVPNSGTAAEDVSSPASVRADRKAQAIVAAARQHFYRDGYAATSVDAISRGAGIGKATIYKHFGSKQALFAAVVAQENRHGLDEIRTILAGPGAIAGRLERAGHVLIDLLTAPDFIASYRMVMSEATRLPELAALYYTGAAQLLATLSDSFAALAQAGDLETSHPQRAAEHFVGLIRGDLQLRALLGLDAPVDARDRAEIVASGVAVFARFYGR